VAVVDEVRETLEKTVPDFSNRSGDWAGVLAMARADEGAGARGRVSPFQGRRRRHLIALAAAVLVVAVGTTAALGTALDLFGDGKPHVQTGYFPTEGEKGSFTVRILFMRDAAGNRTREWRIGPGQGPEGSALHAASTGQYAQVTGRGRIVRIGGRAQAWNARFEGFMTRPGAAKQRVVITMKGRPQGVWVLTPLQPGFLKRDSGTLRYAGAMG
jgi:hypothetical protein